MDLKKRLVRIAAAVIVAVILPANTAVAKKAGASQLASEWWQWVLSIPSSINPLYDTTGDNCTVGQHGANWFLAGSWVGPVTRDCDVPHGVTVFFPVINEVNFDTPGQCGQGAPLPSSFYRSLSKAFIDGAANLSVVLDGKPVTKMSRMQSPVFELVLPEDNVFVFAGICADLTDGIYSPAVDDGFYVQLSGLSVGEHTLQIHAENPSQGATLDVTYNLNVVPVVTH
jgi:hypothetical protein